ncbi:MAG: hypothetical protein A2161_18340, partial [Candidatus Schekmanbacteria bacterium RBG_13_48_7]
MEKNKSKRGTLSAELADVLSRLSSEGKKLFTVEEFARTIRRSKPKIWRILSFLNSNGWIIRLARGKYLIIPLEAGPESTWSENSLVIATHLANPSAVAYWSACNYWHWTEQIPRTVFVQTTQKTMHNNKIILGVQYRLVQVQGVKFFGTIVRWSGENHFTITDREKTFVDMIDHPSLCGGIYHVIKILQTAEELNWDKINGYMEKMNNGAIYKRLGFLTEFIGNKLKLPHRKIQLKNWNEHL